MFTLRLFKIKKHTRRVILFKRGLPVFAFLLASLMMIWPVLFAEQKERFSLPQSGQKIGSAKMDMENVRFVAQDKKKQPLTVTTTKVLETDAEHQLVTLYKPIATYTMASGVLLTAVTSHGVVDQVNELMTFEDEVTATTDTGYKAVSSQVVCRNRDGVMDSQDPVTVTGPTGRLKAEGFHITDKGDYIHFTGKTDSTILSADGDIRIRSTNGLVIAQPNQTVTATESVVVTQQNKVITADKMILFYWTKDQNPDTRIKKIEAFGHVVAESEGHKITGDTGIYDPQKGTITMTDNVVLFEGNSHLAGQTATLNLNTGESTLVPVQSTTGQTGRIKGRLLPAELKGDHS